MQIAFLDAEDCCSDLGLPSYRVEGFRGEMRRRGVRGLTHECEKMKMNQAAVSSSLLGEKKRSGLIQGANWVQDSQSWIAGKG